MVVLRCTGGGAGGFRYADCYLLRSLLVVSQYHDSTDYRTHGVSVDARTVLRLVTLTVTHTCFGDVPCC